MAKKDGKSAKKDAAKAKSEGDYEFQLPDFDEQAFVAREVRSARASFYALGVGFAAGIVSVLLWVVGVAWWTGWLPVLGSIAIIRPTLMRVGFPEDMTTPKAILGFAFTTFFTALGVWILGINFV